MNTTYDVAAAFERIEDLLISSMKANLTRHLNEEQLNQLTWTQWQALQVDALKKFRDGNPKLFQKEFDSINKNVKKMLKDTYKNSTMTEEKILKSYIGQKPRMTQKEIAELHRIHEDKLQALINETTNNMRKAENAILRVADDSYRKIIFDSQVYFNTGSGTLSKAIDMATHDFLSQGLNCIQYKNGNIVNIASYSEMALRTADTRAALQGEAYKRDEWGESLVMITYRSSACPRCVKYIGKVFVDDVWGTVGAKENNKYPLLSSAISDGLYHPNCKDSHTTYFEGITKQRTMTKDEENEAVRRYKLQQEQRYNERQIRKYKRLENGSISEENKSKYAAKRKEWQKRNNEFVKANDDVLKREYWREQVKVQDITKPTTNVASPATPVKPQLRVVSNKTEALDALTKEVGFTSITPSISKLNDNIMVNSTNQLIKLEDRFGAIGKSKNPRLESRKGMKCNAKVSCYTVNPSEQWMTLEGIFFSNEVLHTKIRKEMMDINWSMPCLDNQEDLLSYTVTHEYGHMLQNNMIYDYMKESGLNFNAAEIKIRKECYNDIISIAKTLNPNFDLLKQLSDYGKSSKAEFFAEVFANSQLGAPNDLGKAMEQWLKGRGY